MANTLGIAEFMALVPDEEAAVKYFESKRWPDGPHCPRCESRNVRRCRGIKPMPLYCRGCGKHFSVRIGTPMQRSKLPIRTWLLATYLITSSRKGISSIQLGRQLGVTQRTAWFLNHRIREAFAEQEGMLSGTVEIDETYIGGKERNKHWDKKLKAGRGPTGKIPVIGLRARSRQVRAFPAQGADAAAVRKIVEKNICPGSTIYTDGALAYQGIEGYDHDSVNHSRKEYVRGLVSTNGIESVWAVLKRAYMGTYHHVSKKHLHRYCNEICERLNTGHDTLRLVDRIIDGMIGRCLTYKTLTKG